MFFTFRSDNNESTRNKIRGIAIDENDDVYIVVEIISRKDNVPQSQYKLLILNTNGEKKGERFLPVINEDVTYFGKYVYLRQRKH